FGLIMTLFAGIVIKQFFPSKEQTPILMELPSCKMPEWGSVFRNVFDRGRIFVTEAGKIIMAISVILWFLASFPKAEMPQSGTQTGSVSQAATVTAQTESSFNPNMKPE